MYSKSEILSGTKFGALTVIKRADDYISPKGQHEKRYLCRCECGRDYITRGSWLKSGKSSCCNQCSKIKISLKRTKRFIKLSIWSLDCDRKGGNREVRELLEMSLRLRK